MENAAITNNANGLAAALAKAQGAIPNPKKDTENPFFKSKYADLAAVWDAARPHLSANGLSFIQMPSAEGNKVTVTGKLLHASGEWIESSISGLAKDASPQAIGSCITYLRRYQLSAMLGIAAEADDDGNAASIPAAKPKTARQERPTFANGIPMEQHLAEQKAEQKPEGQIDLGPVVVHVKSGSILKKSGEKEKKPWILYGIDTEEYGTIATFSKSVYDRCGEACTKGEPIGLTTEPTPKGPQATGYYEVETA